MLQFSIYSCTDALQDIEKEVTDGIRDKELKETLRGMLAELTQEQQEVPYHPQLLFCYDQSTAKLIICRLPSELLQHII